jgi:hypothetical protein
LIHRFHPKALHFSSISPIPKYSPFHPSPTGQNTSHLIRLIHSKNSPSHPTPSTLTVQSFPLIHFFPPPPLPTHFSPPPPPTPFHLSSL